MAERKDGWKPSMGEDVNVKVGQRDEWVRAKVVEIKRMNRYEKEPATYYIYQAYGTNPDHFGEKGWRLGNYGEDGEVNPVKPGSLRIGDWIMTSGGARCVTGITFKFWIIYVVTNGGIYEFSTWSQIQDLKLIADQFKRQEHFNQEIARCLDRLNLQLDKIEEGVAPIKQIIKDFQEAIKGQQTE